MIPSREIEVLEYLDLNGRSPFAKWFDALSPEAAAKVIVAFTRLEQGNFSSSKSVGNGIYEHKIHFGPGLRIYFGKDGPRLIILLAAGTKKRQQKDIQDAMVRWLDYKRRKNLSSD